MFRKGDKVEVVKDFTQDTVQFRKGDKGTVVSKDRGDGYVLVDWDETLKTVGAHELCGHGVSVREWFVNPKYLKKGVQLKLAPGSVYVHHNGDYVVWLPTPLTRYDSYCKKLEKVAAGLGMQRVSDGSTLSGFSGSREKFEEYAASFVESRFCTRDKWQRNRAAEKKGKTHTVPLVENGVFKCRNGYTVVVIKAGFDGVDISDPRRRAAKQQFNVTGYMDLEDYDKNGKHVGRSGHDLPKWDLVEFLGKIKISEDKGPTQPRRHVFEEVGYGAPVKGQWAMDGGGWIFPASRDFECSDYVLLKKVE